MRSLDEYCDRAFDESLYGEIQSRLDEGCAALSYRPMLRPDEKRRLPVSAPVLSQAGVKGAGSATAMHQACEHGAHLRGDAVPGAFSHTCLIRLAKRHLLVYPHQADKFDDLPHRFGRQAGRHGKALELIPGNKLSGMPRHCVP